MDKQEVMGLLREIAEGAETAKWCKLRPNHRLILSKDSTAKSYQGLLGDWIVTLMSFDAAPQGFPEETRGYDGMGLRKDGKALRLTRELAEKLFKLAEERAPKE